MANLVQKDAIKIIGDTAGVKLKDEVAHALAADVEYRLREVVQEATKFMKHSHRDKLTTDDVNSALRLQKVESLYGYSFRDPIRFLRAVGHKDLFFREDKELDFKEILASALPKRPCECSFQFHWLAVSGVQPVVPENPVIAMEAPKVETPTTQTVLVQSSSTPETNKISVKPAVKHTLSRELQLYFEKVTEAVSNLHAKNTFVPPRVALTTPTVIGTPILTPLTVGDKRETFIHPLYGETTKSAVTFFEAAKNSVANDPGLHQLVPYFARFISQEIRANLQNLGHLHALLRLLDALINNPHLNVDLYLHQLMPSIMTCLVGKQLCQDPATQDHWSLRDYAANLVSLVCSRFGDRYQDLQPRITKTLVRAFLDPTRPLSTNYGAIVGLSRFGPHCVELVIVPQISDYVRLLEPKMNQNADPVLRMEAERCYQALLTVTGNFLKHALDFYNNIGHPIVLQKRKKLKTQHTHSKPQLGQPTTASATGSQNIEGIDNTESNTRMSVSGLDSASTSELGTSAPTSTTTTPTSQKKRKRQSYIELSGSLLQKSFATQEIENITARYEEFYAIFGEKLHPFICTPSPLSSTQQSSRNAEPTTSVTGDMDEGEDNLNDAVNYWNNDSTLFGSELQTLV